MQFAKFVLQPEAGLGWGPGQNMVQLVAWADVRQRERTHRLCGPAKPEIGTATIHPSLLG